MDFPLSRLCGALKEILYLVWSKNLKETEPMKTDAAGTVFLKASIVMKTRYAHQVIAMELDYLLKRVYKDSGTEMDFED